MDRANSNCWQRKSNIMDTGNPSVCIRRGTALCSPVGNSNHSPGPGQRRAAIRHCLIPLMFLATCGSVVFGEAPQPRVSLASFADRLHQHDGLFSSRDTWAADSCGSEPYSCEKEGKCDTANCLEWLPRADVPFPMMAELVEGRDVTLPLPIGASIIWTDMYRTVGVSDVRLATGGNPPQPANRVSVPETTFNASSQIARVDLWVLPFLNVYGVVGETTSTGRVDVVVDQFPLAGSPPTIIDVDVRLNGPTYGFGATGGIGNKDYFLMVDINKTWTKFSSLDSELTALVVTPRVGMVIDHPYFKGTLHVGAMHQDTAQTVEVTVGALDVEIDQFEPKRWNFLVGGLWAVNERLMLMVEGGMGGRSYVISGLTVRF